MKDYDFLVKREMFLHGVICKTHLHISTSAHQKNPENPQILLIQIQTKKNGLLVVQFPGGFILIHFGNQGIVEGGVVVGLGFP
jgi:hypothetical protein